MPHVDGVFVTMPPMHLPSNATIADIPLITGKIHTSNGIYILLSSFQGDTKDEGTLLSFGSLNVTFVLCSFLAYPVLTRTYLAPTTSLLAMFPSTCSRGRQSRTSLTCSGSIPPIPPQALPSTQGARTHSRRSSSASPRSQETGSSTALAVTSSTRSQPTTPFTTSVRPHLTSLRWMHIHRRLT